MNASSINNVPFAIWITGLPASGKSTVVAHLLPKL
jgi:adenylylsulfate kinase-like enzyme